MFLYRSVSSDLVKMMPSWVPLMIVSIGPGNGLVPSGTKPLPEPMSTQILSSYVVTRLQRVKHECCRCPGHLHPSCWCNEYIKGKEMHMKKFNYNFFSGQWVHRRWKPSYELLPQHLYIGRQSLILGNTETVNYIGRQSQDMMPAIASIPSIHKSGTWDLSQYKDCLSWHRDSHYKDKMVISCLIFIMGIFILLWLHLYIEMPSTRPNI